MKKIILIGLCVFISIMLIVAIIFRFSATKSLGDSFLGMNNLTEIISLFLIIGGTILDIILIIVTFVICNK